MPVAAPAFKGSDVPHSIYVLVTPTGGFGPTSPDVDDVPSLIEKQNVRLKYDRDTGMVVLKNANLPVFPHLLANLREAGLLKTGWDGQGAPPPAPSALSRARYVLDLADSALCLPVMIAATVEGGIGFVFKSPRGSATLEIYNDGEAAVAFDGPKGLTVQAVEHGCLPRTIKEIKHFVR